jgi:hypothetical protein
MSVEHQRSQADADQEGLEAQVGKTPGKRKLEAGETEPKLEGPSIAEFEAALSGGEVDGAASIAKSLNGKSAGDETLRQSIANSSLADVHTLYLSLLVELGNTWPEEVENFYKGVEEGAFVGPRICPAGTAKELAQWAVFQAEMTAGGKSDPIDIYRARFASLWEKHEGKSTDPDNPKIDSSKGPKTERARAVFDEIIADANLDLAKEYEKDDDFREYADNQNAPEVINPKATGAMQQLWSALDPRNPAKDAATFNENVVFAGDLSEEEVATIESSNAWATRFYEGAAANNVAFEEVEQWLNVDVPYAGAPEEATEPRSFESNQEAYQWVADNLSLDVNSPSPRTADGGYVFYNGGFGALASATLPEPSPLSVLIQFSCSDPGYSHEALITLNQGETSAEHIYAQPEKEDFPEVWEVELEIAMLPPPGDAEIVLPAKKSVQLRVYRDQEGKDANDDEARLAQAQAQLDARLAPGGDVYEILASSEQDHYRNTLRGLNEGLIEAKAMILARDPSFIERFIRKTQSVLTGAQGQLVWRGDGLSYITQSGIGGTVRGNRVYARVLGTSADEIARILVHEGVHATDTHRDSHVDDSKLEQLYRSEFRAYWLDGRFDHLSAAIDPSMAARGPKSPRANAIFSLLYERYGYVRPAYLNKDEFRQVADNLTVPDGVNLTVSPGLATVRKVLQAAHRESRRERAGGAAGGRRRAGADFDRLRSKLEAAYSELDESDRAEIRSNAAWRDLVDAIRFATSISMASDKELRQRIKSLLGIPS